MINAIDGAMGIDLGSIGERLMVTIDELTSPLLLTFDLFVLDDYFDHLNVMDDKVEGGVHEFIYPDRGY